jgi:hypothetical protein
MKQNNTNMKTNKIWVLLSLWSLILIACGSEVVTPDTGALEIKITVGPLCPVEPCNKTKDELKQIYETYSVVLSNEQTKNVVSTQKVSSVETYGEVKMENLPVGEYELTIKPSNLFTSQNFPQKVGIEKDKTTSLQIDIDTGIR